MSAQRSVKRKDASRFIWGNVTSRKRAVEFTTHLDHIDGVPNIQQSKPGKLQPGDRRKAQEVDPGKERLMANACRSAEDASDGFYGSLWACEGQLLAGENWDC
jgi:hypothetical protein